MQFSWILACTLHEDKRANITDTAYVSTGKAFAELHTKYFEYLGHNLLVIIYIFGTLIA